MSDWEDYNENLAFDPANSMPRCDIDELKAKIEQSEKMRDLQAEYACKLEEKLRIAEEAFKKIVLYRYGVNDTDQEDWFKIATYMAEVAQKAQEKIKK